MIESGSQPGSFRIFRDDGLDPWEIEYRCPCGCDSYRSLPLYRAGEAKPYDTAWLWDGNEQAPTLSPSIRHLNGCKFHGYLQAGRWSSAGDGAPVSPRVYTGGPSQPTLQEQHPVTDQTPAPTDQAAPAAAHSPTPPVKAEAIDTPLGKMPVVESGPIGYVKTHVLAFFNGVLHQLHENPHSNDNPPKVLVPVPGTANTTTDAVKAMLKPLEDRVTALEKHVNTPAAPPVPAAAPTPPPAPPTA